MDPGLLGDIGWIVVAFLAGAGAHALRLPPLVGYLLAGMGLAALGVQEGAVIDRVGEVGVALLLFIVGLHVRWANLLRTEVLGVGSAHLALVAAIGGGVAWALGVPPLGAVAVGVSLGVSSLVLAAKGLNAQGGLRAYHGRVAIGIVLLQTLVATGVTVMLGDAPSPWALALLSLPLLRPLLSRLLAYVDGGELLVMLGLALVIGATLAFRALGVGAELGALVMGMLLAGHDRADDLADVLSGLKDAGLAAFFLSVGLVGIPSADGLLLVAALLGLLLLKGGLFYGFLVGARLRARTAFLATVPTTTFSGFTLIVGSIAVQARALPEAALTVLAAATAISYLLNAPASRFALPLWAQVRPVLERFERAGPHPARSPSTLGHAQFLVVGMGRAGTAAYDHLVDWMQCTAGLDTDPERIRQHRDAGRRVAYGDARSASTWDEIDLAPVESVLLALTDATAKLDAIRALRRNDFGGAIIALTADPDRREELLAAGASAVYLSVEQAGRALARHGLRQRRDPAPTTVTLDVKQPPSSTPADDESDAEGDGAVARPAAMGASRNRTPENLAG